jgi:Bacterial regulatory protein, Fis family
MERERGGRATGPARRGTHATGSGASPVSWDSTTGRETRPRPRRPAAGVPRPREHDVNEQGASRLDAGPGHPRRRRAPRPTTRARLAGPRAERCPEDPRWSPAAAQRRPRSPHRRIVVAMHPLIPRTGLGEVRSRPEPGRTRQVEVVPLAREAKLHTFFDQGISAMIVQRPVSGARFIGGSPIELFLRQSFQDCGEAIYRHAHRELDQHLLPMVLHSTGGNQLRAAQLLGITRRTLRVKLRELGLSVTKTVEADDDLDRLAAGTALTRRGDLANRIAGPRPCTGRPSGNLAC